MKTGYTSNIAGIEGADLGDIYVSRDFFSAGRLWGSGYNTNGELGNLTTGNTSSPVQVATNSVYWRHISAGRLHTAAISIDGSLRVWGSNTTYGQLGTGNTTSVSSPVQTISGGYSWKQVSAGESHTTAIKTDGTLWVWGNNGSNQLGDNTAVSKSSPVQTISGGTNWKQVSAGSNHTTAIKNDGTLWLWGNNGSGRLGDNTATAKSSPVQTIAGGTAWKQVAAGDQHTTAIKTDGTVWTWGNNASGQLGDSTTVMKSSPIQTIAGGTNWKQVSAGYTHSAAIKTDGTLWLWGSGGSGELGSGDITSRSSPVQTIVDGNTWKYVSLGNAYTAAIKTDGTLWTWGYNNVGQLGNGGTTSVLSPVQTLSGGTNWRTVSAGYDHIMALTYDEDF